MVIHSMQYIIEYICICIYTVVRLRMRQSKKYYNWFTFTCTHAHTSWILQPIGWIVQYNGYKKSKEYITVLAVLDLRMKVIKPNIKY